VAAPRARGGEQVRDVTGGDKQHERRHRAEQAQRHLEAVRRT
jgi:hypothetical protein